MTGPSSPSSSSPTDSTAAAPDAATPLAAGTPVDRVQVRACGRTDVGRLREHNEDAFVIAELLTPASGERHPFDVQEHVCGDGGTLFMVADGMGGAAAGEIASAMAIEVVLAELRSQLSDGAGLPAELPPAERFAAALRAATEAANLQIHRYATLHPELRGMGTTATVAALHGNELYLAQVGDSRAYLVRAGVARQITKDQSLMQKLIEAGEITAEEAEVSDRRNIILQALGPDSAVKVDLTHQQLRSGDVLALCSDGLSGQVRADEIARAVTDGPDLDAACRSLIDSANASGGPDNITVVLARFDGATLAAPDAGDEVGHRIFPIGGETPTPSLPIERWTRRSSAQTTASALDVRAPGRAAAAARGDAQPAPRPIPVTWMVGLALAAAVAVAAAAYLHLW